MSKAITRNLNRALYFAALEKAACEAKETDKQAVIDALDGETVFESKNGKITRQERTDFTLNISATKQAIESGKLSLDLFLQNVKANASLKTVIAAMLGENAVNELLTPNKVPYWMLKPTEATKARAAQSFAEFTE